MYNKGYRCGPGPWGGRGPFFQSNTTPVNITETDAAYIISLYAPSLDKQAISVTTQRDVLSIRYNGKALDENTRFTRREYRVEEIDRSFDLKGRVQTDAIKASYADGVLKVELPKTDAAKGPELEVPVR